MSVAIVVVTDGRGACLQRTLESLDAMLTGDVVRSIIYDDSADPEYTDWLKTLDWPVLVHPDGRQGFDGANRYLRSMLTGWDVDHIWWQEDDFVLNRPVDLTELADVLDENPNLMQMALRRQPWNQQEKQAGGVVEEHPDAYFEMVDHAHRHWLEHRLYYTTNPHLFRQELCAHGWPTGANSEGRYTHQLLENPAVRFGLWGRRTDAPWVTHIGTERAGVGY